MDLERRSVSGHQWAPGATIAFNEPHPGQELHVGILRPLSDFDPDGDGTEHPEAVPAATDGSATTYWTTESYSSFDKPGVGIVLGARRGVDLSEVTVTTDTPGYTAVIEASNRPDGGFKVVSDSQTVEEQTTFDLEGGDYRYYLIWITSLDGHAHVNEVRARS